MEEDKYLTLVYKELDGTLTEAEAAELAAWLSASAANRAAADEVRQAWEASKSLGAEPVVDLDAEFALLEDRIEDDDGTPKTPVIRLWWQRPAVWASAAAVLLLAVAGYLLIPGPAPTEPEWRTAEATDGPVVVDLPDGSTVHLNRGARLRYQQAFAADGRTVKLKGEAFFDVKHDREWPFTVQTKRHRIEVLGTSFYVRSHGANRARVDVVSGTVSFGIEYKKGSASVVLRKGQAAEYDLETEDFVTEVGRNENDAAWHTRRLAFNDAPLALIVAELGELHGAAVVAEGEILSCPLTFTFDDEPLDASLETICAVLGCKIAKGADATYTLSGGGCQ